MGWFPPGQSQGIILFSSNLLFHLLLSWLGNTDWLIQDTCTEQNTSTNGVFLTFNTKSPCCTLTEKQQKQSVLSILTGKKVVLSLRCPRSSPKGVPPLNYLPPSLHPCWPRLQRPTVNRQRVRSVRGTRQTHKRKEQTWKTRMQVGSRPTSETDCVYTSPQSMAGSNIPS